MARLRDVKDMSIPPPPTVDEEEHLVPELLDERLQNIHKVLKAMLDDDFSQNVSIFPKHDSFVPLERDMFHLVEKVQEMSKTSEMAIAKIKEALGQIIDLTTAVRDATELIKSGKFEVPFDTDSSISEVKELKKRFQYLFSVIRLLVAESQLSE